MALTDRIERPGPKRLLAIDGGGIRGVLALEMLQKIETVLKAQSGRDDFCLADYFDYICRHQHRRHHRGVSVDGHVGRRHPGFLRRRRRGDVHEGAPAETTALQVRERAARAASCRRCSAPTTTFGSDTLRTLLLLVLRNATTDSPWPLCNNPYAKYNDVDRRDSNLKFPLWQLVRASTAAPTFFPPEVIVIPHADPAKEKEFIFVDGGVTMYNNPAFQMFLMATLDRYWPRKPDARWRTGADQMLIVSVGTGTSPDVQARAAGQRHEPAVQR